MYRKSELVNALFIIGFAVYGYGSYIGNRQLAKGLLISSLPFLAIILFYLIDAVYRRRVGSQLTGFYWLCMLYIGTAVVSMFVGLRNGIPGVNAGNAMLASIMFLAPFNAAVIVQYYNKDDPDFDFARLLLLSLGLLVAINVVGWAGGVRSRGFSVEGRANFPFIRGVYTGAHLLSVVTLILLFFLRDFNRRPIRYLLLLGFVALNLALMVKINSRLSFMIFLALAVLFVSRTMRVVRGLYTISLFTMPLLLSFSLLVYQILSLPVFQAIVQRVNKEDITTFNGRSYIWNAVADWAWTDRTGILFGNGYKGHYKLGLLDYVAQLWGEPNAYNLHSHSTFTEVVITQGLFGLILLYIIFWKGFVYYRRQYLEGSVLAPVFGGFAYLLFDWQVDIFCYGMDLGHAVLFVIVSPLCVRPSQRVERSLEGGWVP